MEENFIWEWNSLEPDQMPSYLEFGLDLSFWQYDYGPIPTDDDQS